MCDRSGLEDFVFHIRENISVAVMTSPLRRGILLKTDKEINGE